jgi:tetratricopeptide (TPR) repeat protein
MAIKPSMQPSGSKTRARAAGSAATGAARILAAAVDHHRRGLLEEAAGLYRRVLHAMPEQPDALHLLGQIEQANGNLVEALALIERAIAASGGVAAYHVSRGSVLLSLGRAEEAAAMLRQALALAPDSAEASNVLGNAMLTLGDPASAIECYRRAITLRPQYAEAHNNLGSALRSIWRLEEAEAELARAIELRPNYASAFANLGLVLQERGRYGEAMGAYDRAIAADPAHPTARANRAMLLLLLGRLREGFAEYEWRWRMPGFATPAPAFPQPKWDGGDLAGRTLFVHAEQGLGSAIQFVRYVRIAAAKGGRVLLECRRPLHRLFESSRGGADGIEVVMKGEPLPAFDRHAPLMSLPNLLGATLDTIPAEIPYLEARPADIAAWRERLAGVPTPRIGLVWAGNPRHENDRNRSMPAARFAQLIERSRASFFSLQIPAAAEDLAALPSGSVTDLAPALGDFADTAAVIENLDLVISVDTAAAHLAGALGKPVWLLLPYVPEWRWMLERDDSPWYPTMRLFRQRCPGDWREVIERLTVALQSWQPDQARP